MIDNLSQDVEAQMKNSILSLLAIKPRTTWEIKNKLRQRFPDQNHDELIVWLISKKYLDDIQYVHDFIDEVVRRRPMGKNLIRRKLQQRGLTQDIIDTALVELGFEQELKMARAAIKSRSALNFEDKARLMRFLDSKGFSEEVARKAVFEN